MKQMVKTVLFVMGGCLFALIVAVGVYLSVPPRMLDFRGTVTEIVPGETYTYHIALESGSSYVVAADTRTDIYYVSDKDTALTRQDIQVGDTIEGDYRRRTDENTAKFIRIWK